MSEDERRQIHDVVRQLGFESPSALVRCAIHNELTGRGAASTDSEERVAATLERVLRDVARIARGQQALFTVVDTLVKTFLTCVPDPRLMGCRNRWRVLGTGTVASQKRLGRQWWAMRWRQCRIW